MARKRGWPTPAQLVRLNVAQDQRARARQLALARLIGRVQLVRLPTDMPAPRAPEKEAR